MDSREQELKKKYSKSIPREKMEWERKKYTCADGVGKESSVSRNGVGTHGRVGKTAALTDANLKAQTDGGDNTCGACRCGSVHSVAVVLFLADPVTVVCLGLDLIQGDTLYGAEKKIIRHLKSCTLRPIPRINT